MINKKNIIKEANIINFFKNIKKINIEISLCKFTIFYSIFLIFFNLGFLKEVYTITKSIGYTIGACFVIYFIFLFFNAIIFNKYTAKFTSIIILLINAPVLYFMNAYNVLIDKVMILNVLETNSSETTELLNLKFLIYMFFLGIIPSFFILKNTTIKYKTFLKEVLYKFLILFISLISIVFLLLINYKDTSSYARNNKALKYKIIPINYISSTNSIIHKKIHNKFTATFTTLTDDMIITKNINNNDKKNIVIFIVGEAARANNFSLNGYGKNTNEYLEKENILYFNNVRSCGTATAISVPCMFSHFERKKFNVEEKNDYENLTDFLQKAGFYLMWLDNNSDCKGVCNRIEDSINYTKKENINKYCNGQDECFDEVMLENLQEKIDNTKSKNIAIFLHQKGSHGPAYYLRYPKNFEKFKPVCKSENFSKCDNAEIVNAYDNTINYTSYFINKSIDFLKQNENYNSMLFYVSDHGQSLGEKGVYLHGAPYFIAPDEQTNIPMIMWFSNSFKNDFNIDENCLLNKKNSKFSHDNVFHSFLGLFNIETKYYNSELDIFNNCLNNN